MRERCTRPRPFGATINSTFIGSLPGNGYGNPENWSPAQVPNNTGGNTYHVSIPLSVASVSSDTTISTLIVGDSDGGLVVNANHFTVIDLLTNFDTATHTLTGGSYQVGGNDGFAAIFQFPGADIVHNAAHLTLFDSGVILNESVMSGLWSAKFFRQHERG